MSCKKGILWNLNSTFLSKFELRTLECGAEKDRHRTAAKSGGRGNRSSEHCYLTG